jgi:methyl coenzyme M reductase beta subunit
MFGFFMMSHRLFNGNGQGQFDNRDGVLRHDKTKMIKQGMMQQLLTGRVRLIKPSEEETEST